MQGDREDFSHLFVEVVQCAVARLDSTEQEVAIGSVASGLAHIELLHRGPHAPAHVKGKRVRARALERERIWGYGWVILWVGSWLDNGIALAQLESVEPIREFDMERKPFVLRHLTLFA